LNATFEDILAIVCEVAGVAVDQAERTLADLGLITDQQRNLFRTQLRLRLTARSIGASSDRIPNADDVTLMAVAQTIHRAMGLGLLIVGPSPRFAGREEADQPVHNLTVVRIFYATDRKAIDSSDPKKAFSGERSPDGELSFGTCEVRIPRDHRMGVLEKPSIWRVEFRENPEKHFALIGLERLDSATYFRAVAQRVADSRKKEAFVFIHGYNVSFQDAAKRTAQISYDLGFPGAPILYSWPSGGKLLAYFADENNVEWSTPHLQTFLTTLRKQTSAQRIHLIAHSMGNRALTRALASLSAGPDRGSVLFHQIVLTAPDIDTGVFLQLARAIETTGERITLYASSKDRALLKSQQLHRGPRAGESGENIVIVDGIDTVDASEVDTGFLGHSYFGDTRSVLSDLFVLLQDGHSPGQRPGMRQMERKEQVYWRFAR
jgi:esterase/lipase superfamily enzyme